jgi:hypothetical protein
VCTNEDLWHREPAQVIALAGSVNGGGRCNRRAAAESASAVALLAALLVPFAARAQCNSSANPTPAAAPAQTNFSNQSFGPAPLSAYYLHATGQAGCNGANNGSINGPGQDGFTGQPGGSFSSVNSAITVVGGVPPSPTTFPEGAIWYVNGGPGGLGGQGGTDLNGSATTGNGGAAGNGGSVSVQFSGSVVPDSSGGLPEIALDVQSLGGNGGRGADSNAGGGEPLYSGKGGTGGQAGQATLNASGTLGFYGRALQVLAVGGAGGAGGDTPTPTDPFLVDSYGGNGGNGGNGGTATLVYQNGTLTSSTPAGQIFPMQAVADGGEGGGGGAADSDTGSFGGNAGNGGNGGTASAELGSGGQIVFSDQMQPVNSQYQPGSGVTATANGGAGGGGGNVGGGGIRDGGGAGGNGGNAGSASVTILGSIDYTANVPTGQSAAGLIGGEGVLVQANGGAGGAGAGAQGVIVGEAGNGGTAGAGGNASLTLGDGTNTATIKTNGAYTHGALVQSIGGAGGDGGSVSFVLSGIGGAGAAGGNGGTVTVNSDHAFVTVGSTSGEGSVPLIAQSIGGGGGSGGDASGVTVGAGFEIGGNSGQGGNGGTVKLTLGQNSVFGSLDASGGAGILAQSIGGSGGNAGNATSTGGGVINMVIGGDAHGGGAGGQVTIDSGALVTTYGDHAAGIKAQSIGGGGGNGGNATTFNAFAFLSGALAIGGRGGGGGPAGPVSLTNTGQISTYGSDAEGVLLQSIGGGGGSGGSAIARAVALSPSPDIPAISVSVAIGGAGGAGNTGGNVSLDNSGLITTAGDGAVGVFAQSVGGGGGAGGDATAASYSASATKGASISVSVALGGSGGVGGTGGAVNLANSGLIATLGQDAYGVFAQSIGGGGGDGGTGDATASAADAKSSFSAAIAVGGSGGTGGNAGTVGLTNDGSIATRGDGADAVFAQSVGGGGGAGGGGTATASGGKLAIAVGVGGSGGVGGNGNTVTVINNGNIVTRGTASTGIFAQSVGGGGGKGGKGGATAGGVTPLSNAQAMFDILGNGLGLNQGVQNRGDNILQIGQIGEDIKASYDELTALFKQPQADENPEEGTATQINVAVSVGGSGGAGGQGGAVNATNTGAIGTYGAQSYGIFAQSIGGGGGSGGAASSTGSANDDSQVQSAVAVGGSGGAAGSGGAVSVTKSTTGNIETQGVAAFGIYAQSVGGGGGNGALAGVVSGSLKSLSIGVGGNGGGAGDGGTVSVSTSDTSNATGIQTLGKHSIGIFAQSVGGGGGVATTMTTDETFDPSKIIVNPQGRIADVQGVSLTFGGRNGSTGKGGEVDVAVNGNVQTQGLDAHGVLAQSIGGGGGLVVGGQVILPAAGTGGAGGAGGDGGPVTVNVTNGFIGTASDGAYGVIAQSIGGGGGFAGDPSQVQSYQAGTALGIKANSGNGGTVSVAVNGSLISTTGKFAPAVFAQSVGGGGGLEAYSVAGGLPQVLARGTAGGAGTGNGVTVALTNGATVRALGSGSAGILAQSDGTSSGPIRISIDSSSSVLGGAPSYADLQHIDSAAVHLLGGTGNQITNAGSISTNVSNQGEFAIVADGTTNTHLTNTGKITGDVILGPSGANVVDNLPGGVIDTPTMLNVGAGTVNNAGTLNVGGANSIGNTVLTGNLVQSPTGVLHVQIDPLSGRSDLLNVTGTASLGGTVLVDPMSYLKRSSTVLTAAGGIQPGTTLTGTSTLLYSFTPVVQGNTLAIATDADFAGASSSGSATQRSVGAYLNRLWDSADPSLEPIFAGFGKVGNTASYTQTLSTVSGQELVGIAAARYQASQIFARSAFSCPEFVDDTTVRKQDSCAWLRTTGMWDNRSADGSFPGFTWQGVTVKVGGQVQLQPGWFLGGAFGYETDRFTGNNNLTSANGNAVLGVIALKHEIGPWILTGAVDAGYGWMNSSRSVPIAGAVATASPDSFNVGMHVRAAYQIPLGRFYLEPAFDGDLNDINLSSYTESGAGAFNLKVNSANNLIATGTPNLRVGARLDVGSATVDAYVGAGVSFIAGNNYTTDASFAAAPGFGTFTNTLTNAHVAGKFSAGVEVFTAQHLDVRLEYDGVVAAHEVENGGQVRFKYRF